MSVKVPLLRFSKNSIRKIRLILDKRVKIVQSTKSLRFTPPAHLKKIKINVARTTYFISIYYLSR